MKQCRSVPTRRGIKVRVRFQGLAGAPPTLILAATDGYANSFHNETSFQQVTQDLWGMDDITVGLIWRHWIRPE